MQQELEANGLNPNPQRLWQYVYAVKGRVVPCVGIINVWNDDVVRLIEEYPRIDFVYEYDVFDIALPLMKNILFRDWNRMTYEQWLRNMRTMDYALCTDENVSLQISMCGVRCVSTVSELEKELKNAHPLDTIERIENWEIANNILTKRK